MEFYCESCLGVVAQTHEQNRASKKCSSCGTRSECISKIDIVEISKNVIGRAFRWLSAEQLTKTGIPSDCNTVPTLATIAIECALRGAKSDVLQIVLDGFADKRGTLPLFFKIEHYAQTDWLRFATEIHAHSRFFSTLTYDELMSIFSFLKDDELRAQVTSIQSKKDASKAFVRARLASTVDELKRILAAPGRELGPPPAGLASSGRLNPAGIPVFYGASDIKTAITELRPQVGEFAVSAEFVPLLDMTLLDLEKVKKFADRIEEQADDEGPASRHYVQFRRRASFLRYFVKQMKIPIGTNSQAAGYLASQVISEFLSEQESFGIHGIKYQSVQRGNAKFSYNVALFQQYSTLDKASLDARGPSVSVSMKGSPFSLSDDQVLVFAGSSSYNASEAESGEQIIAEYGRASTPALRIVTESIRVNYCMPTPANYADIPLEPWSEADTT